MLTPINEPLFSNMGVLSPGFSGELSLLERPEATFGGAPTPI